MDDSSSPASSNLSQRAIEAALDCQWDKALKLNKQILKLDPQNIDALSRLARVYLEQGRVSMARKFYSEVVKIDPYNPIALKNLKIIKSFKSGRRNVLVSSHTKLSPSLFLQEPGKTKVVNLLKVAEPQKLSQTFCGMKAEMLIKNRKVTIVDSNGKYLGVLPDDISFHLLRLIKGGNKFEMFIKSIRVNGLSVLIKETYRSKRFKNQASFLEVPEAGNRHDLLTSLDEQNSEEEPEEQEGEES